MRALLRTDRADDELARALAAAGLYVERLSSDDAPERLQSAIGDLAVIDPRLLRVGILGAGKPTKESEATEPSVESAPLEELCYRRLAAVLDKLDGGTLPDLYATAMAQSERALLRLAVDRTRSLSAGAELLGIHRNTLVRRLEEQGLRSRDEDAGEPRAGKRRGVGATSGKAAGATGGKAKRAATSGKQAVAGKSKRSGAGTRSAVATKRAAGGGPKQGRAAKAPASRRGREAE